MDWSLSLGLSLSILGPHHHFPQIPIHLLRRNEWQLSNIDIYAYCKLRHLVLSGLIYSACADVPPRNHILPIDYWNWYEICPMLRNRNLTKGGCFILLPLKAHTLLHEVSSDKKACSRHIFHNIFVMSIVPGVYYPYNTYTYIHNMHKYFIADVGMGIFPLLAVIA